jgi:hypothetical protein
MASKKFWLIMLAASLAFSLALTGCEQDSDDDGEGFSEPTTGQQTIKYENVDLVYEYDASIPVTDLNCEGTLENGVTCSVTNGKLTATFSTPNSSDTAELARELAWFLFDAGRQFTIMPTEKNTTVKGVIVSGLSAKVDSTSNTWAAFRRHTVSTDGETYVNENTIYHIGNESTIYYIYVDGDVTISSGKITEKDNEHDSTIYNAVNISLKKGWNLIQRDRNTKATSEDGVTITVSLSIAHTNLPWTVVVSSSITAPGVGTDKDPRLVGPGH